MNHEKIDAETKAIAEPLEKYWYDYLDLRSRPVDTIVFNELSIYRGFTRYFERVFEDMHFEEDKSNEDK